MEPLPLLGRTAVVTGASRGIGAATAAALDRAGARVALVSRDQPSLEEVASGLDHDPTIIVADLAERGAPAAIAAQALDELGQVDVLVNNAALAARLAVTETTPEIIDEMLAVNVRAPLLLVSALVPQMIERRTGSIINLS